jgi:hypothetical protein
MQPDFVHVLRVTALHLSRAAHCWSACKLLCFLAVQVDWEGQVAQVDAAKASGSVQQVVLVSSAGGCDPNHFLNHIGQGDILNWKRKTEQHLVGSGLNYTILHPNRKFSMCKGLL